MVNDWIVRRKTPNLAHGLRLLAFLTGGGNSIPAVSFRTQRHSCKFSQAREGASGSPVRCVGLARQFIAIWFDHTQPSPLLPMASTGHPSMASLQSASSSGVVGCLNT
jgi:hypothetical protein